MAYWTAHERHIGWRGGRLTRTNLRMRYDWRRWQHLQLAGQNFDCPSGLWMPQKSSYRLEEFTSIYPFTVGNIPRADHPANNIASFVIGKDDGLPGREMTRQPEKPLHCRIR